MASDSHEMDTTEEDPGSPVGSVSTPRSQTPTQGTRRNPLIVSSALQHFIAPARERGRSNSPTKFPAVKKRPRAPTPPTRNTTRDDGPEPQAHEPPPSMDFGFNTVATDLAALRNMMQIVMTDNQALKGQVSYLTSQITTLNANMSSMSAKITNLSHSNTNTGKSHTPNATERDGPSSTTAAPKQTAKPQPKPKPTLKLSLGGKNADKPSNAEKPPGNNNNTYAGAAASAPEGTGFTTVVNKKKKEKEKLLKPQYDPNDQRVILQIHPDTPPATDVQSTWRYLRLANKAVRHYQRELDYCFVRCHATQKNNLVLQTSLKTCGTDYQPYLEAIKSAFEEEEKLKVTSIDGEARWSKFILHGVPLAASMEDVAMSIQQSYPGILKLAQTPRWLTTETKRQNSTKGMSSVVLAIAGQHTLQSLGYQYLYICNSRCRLAKYLPFGPASQCGKCCRFGHPTAMCRDENPTCGVCGKGHLTRHHTCPAADCRQGGRCTHTPTHCVNCENNLHTSIDPQCPAKAKARQQGQNTEATMEYDTTVDTEPVPPPNQLQDC
jgi:hypothetical protein